VNLPRRSGSGVWDWFCVLNPVGVDSVGGVVTQDSAAKRVAILGCALESLRDKEGETQKYKIVLQGGLRAAIHLA